MRLQNSYILVTDLGLLDVVGGSIKAVFDVFPIVGVYIVVMEGRQLFFFIHRLSGQEESHLGLMGKSGLHEWIEL